MSSSQLPCQVKSTKWKTLSLALTGFDMSTKYFIVTTTKPYVCAIPDTKQNYVYSVIALWLTVYAKDSKILSAKSRHLFERVSYQQTLGMVPVSSISRLSLLNCGAMSTPKLLNTTLETSLPLSVAVYLSCEAHCQISVRLRKKSVRDVT